MLIVNLIYRMLSFSTTSFLSYSYVLVLILWGFTGMLMSHVPVFFSPVWMNAET